MPAGLVAVNAPRLWLLVLLPAACWPAVPTFQHDVLPLMGKRCIACHGAAQPIASGLDLRTLTGVMAGGASGPVVAPGNPDGSRPWTMVRDGKMPIGGAPLPDDEKQLLREWIEKGQFPTPQ